ncbi:MAG: hypothetical protein HQL57_03565 [Magnetococcales bacterium]|nr:hypothetical protein [Magnetococcales bacterium]MBF0156247.1 hypothetical protein [Magnetococcales bacterium]
MSPSQTVICSHEFRAISAVVDELKEALRFPRRDGLRRAMLGLFVDLTARSRGKYVVPERCPDCLFPDCPVVGNYARLLALVDGSATTPEECANLRIPRNDSLSLSPPPP